jgi:hypothetical protein
MKLKASYTFLIQKCNLLDAEWSNEEFVEWFKSLNNKAKESVLKYTLKSFGSNSEQFYFVVQSFVIYVIERHSVGSDLDKEDVFQDAMMNVICKIHFWKDGMGSLMSFLYSLIRDRISSEKYYRMKKGMEIVWEDIDECKYPELQYDGTEDIHRMIDVRKLLGNCVRDCVVEFVASNEGDSIYGRVYEWKKYIGERLMTESLR